MDDFNKKFLVESLLFVTGEPLSINDIKRSTELTEDDIKKAIQELTEEYRSRNGGFFIAAIAEGFQLVSNPEYAPWIRKLRTTATTAKLSMAALETLSIIAYKQPITKIEIEQLRGVNSDGVVKSLLEKRLIKILGKKEVPGKPMLYGTTKDFLQYFGLKDLSDMPTLKELQRDDSL
ncbi:MAG: SMC-Scp complex subunit ScpB [Nitrospirota bacterium]|nr:MAG: SMC-Scp complex subunit ScpB [Nitrospirota bacterium]